MSKNIKLSIIVPVYNEKDRINNFLIIYDFFKKYEPNFELIIVNDGSNDITLEILKQKKAKFPIKIISYSVNKGKGYAVKRGMLVANGTHRIFMDIDLATSLHSFNNFKKYFKDEKYSILIGSRKVKGSKIVVRQSKQREYMGKFFTRLSQFFTGVQVNDFTCGFKCFTAASAEKIFKNTAVNRWGFDSEIIFLSKKYNYEMLEIPVLWKNDSQSRVKFPQDIFYSLADLCNIRINNFKGKYQ